jgi:site-specific DNA-cytosine methylase
MTFVPTTYPTITTDFGDKLCQNNQAVDGGYLLVTPIHDQATRWAGKNGDKTAGKGNGLGIGEPGDPIPTLTQGDRHAVFIENEPFVKSRRAQSTEDYETLVSDAPSPTLNAFDNATETRATVIVPVAFDSNWSGRYDVMDSGLSPTIKSTQPPPAVAFDEYNFSTDDTHHSLRAGTKQSTGVVEMAVRRLTPRECERLMGWPDDHTLLGSDGKEITDGHRYKMCGNGVVSSVAKWVGAQVMRVNG